MPRGGIQGKHRCAEMVWTNRPRTIPPRVQHNDCLQQQRAKEIDAMLRVVSFTRHSCTRDGAPPVTRKRQLLEPSHGHHRPTSRDGLSATHITRITNHGRPEVPRTGRHHKIDREKERERRTSAIAQTTTSSSKPSHHPTVLGAKCTSGRGGGMTEAQLVRLSARMAPIGAALSERDRH